MVYKKQVGLVKFNCRAYGEDSSTIKITSDDNYTITIDETGGFITATVSSVKKTKSISLSLPMKVKKKQKEEQKEKEKNMPTAEIHMGSQYRDKYSNLDGATDYFIWSYIEVYLVYKD